jgi:surface protein
MGGMFDSCTALTSVNGIESWNVSGVTDMTSMFSFATSFNQDISLWDVSNVTSMNNMFGFATSFNQDISSWDVSGILGSSGKAMGMVGFMGGDPLSFSYYDNLLNTWSLLTLKNNVTWDMGTIEYTSAGATARQDIIDNYSWTITDGGEI